MDKKLLINTKMGGYLDERDKVMSLSELNTRIYLLKKKIEYLETIIKDIEIHKLKDKIYQTEKLLMRLTNDQRTL